MTVLAAPGDTWGISGPVFLGLYLLAAVVVVGGAIVHRSRVVAGRSVGTIDVLGPQQVAYLNGGNQLAVWASLGGLRGSGAVGVRPDRRLTTGSALPAGVTPLDQAIHHAARRNLYARELTRDEWVARALTELREGLERQGLALSPAQRRTARNGSLAVLGLLVLGAVRMGAGLSQGKPIAFLLVAFLALAVTAILLNRVPWRTRAADAALRELRRRHTHLAPASAPAYATYGAAGAAMGVALFGTVSLWSLDPGFAEQAEIQRQALSSGGGAGSSSGSSCGGGSSCSGGSSCGGGGGCGGGCGG
ncbi:TIGR04222 domain-containing membrane protein [Micromonospora halophytica]|uniref:TIGR04222 domain-containing protein n=1 Tax=Micromonospora halophytica TaxID=47864 RepID=A0A1C5I6R2_9ACTN|nr:TIGR04222 domain-containing membrane protein [Micromonospora halophytica]SCG53641.1 TIGR04222 domain-containing protein [Micromonospora halophytica]